MNLQRTPPPGGGNSLKNRATITTPSIGGNLLKKQENIEKEEIKNLSKQLQNMQQICAELKNELQQLKIENAKLKAQTVVTSKTNSAQQNKTPPQYETDEEELDRETDWILKKRPSKKRKAVNSPEQIGSNSNLNTVIANNKTPQDDKKAPRPPPIMVTAECEYPKLFNIVKNGSNNAFSIKLLNNKTYKINTFDPDDYRKITKSLSTQNISWYTYENKQSRPIKVIAKNLHHSCDPTDIIQDLKKQGLKITNAVNKLKWKTKEPLDMFLLTFESIEDIKKIFEIKTILHAVVKIEAIKQTTLIPQCKSCQSYGHTQNYCGKQPRCVKCAQKHKTIDCTKSKEQLPKCCNCGEAHPASYRGCIVAKELQKIRDKKIGQRKNNTEAESQTKGKEENKNKNEASTKSISHKPIPIPAPSNLPTYSQVAKTNENVTTHEENILSKILQKLTEQQEFNKSLEQRLQNLEFKIYQSITHA